MIVSSNTKALLHVASGIINERLKYKVHLHSMKTKEGPISTAMDQMSTAMTDTLMSELVDFSKIVNVLLRNILFNKDIARQTWDKQDGDNNEHYLSMHLQIHCSFENILRDLDPSGENSQDPSGMLEIYDTIPRTLENPSLNQSLTIYREIRQPEEGQTEIN